MSGQRKSRSLKTRAAMLSVFQRNPNKPLRTIDIAASIRATAAKEGWEPLEALGQLCYQMHKESERQNQIYGGIIEWVTTGRYQFIPAFFTPSPPEAQNPIVKACEKMMKETKETIEAMVKALIEAAGLPPIDRKTEEKK